MGGWVGDEDVNLDGREEDTVHIQSGEKTVCSPGSEIMNTDTLCCTMQIFQTRAPPKIGILANCWLL